MRFFYDFRQVNFRIEYALLQNVIFSSLGLSTSAIFICSEATLSRLHTQRSSKLEVG